MFFLHFLCIFLYQITFRVSGCVAIKASWPTIAQRNHFAFCTLTACVISFRNDFMLNNAPIGPRPGIELDNLHELSFLTTRITTSPVNPRNICKIMFGKHFNVKFTFSPFYSLRSERNEMVHRGNVK